MQAKFRFILLIILLFWSRSKYAQQDPQYTQYMYNMSVVNPAYTGSAEHISGGLLYRTQWVGINGAPDTGTLFTMMPLSPKVGLGFSVIADQIGPVKETNTFIDFAYNIKLGTKRNLSFGLKAGLTFHNIGLTDVFVIDNDDPFFFQNINSTTPNIGFGTFYFSDNYYAGISIPNLLNSVHLDENGFKLGSETNHYFVTAGYVFNYSKTLKLKPSLLVKSAVNAPTSFDVNINALINNKLEIGLSYRLEDSFSGLVNFLITPNLRIGYAYDNSISELQEFGPASHEFILLFDFNFSRRIISPRFF